MEPIKTYTLEKLNETTVNVLIITTIELNGKTYEIERRTLEDRGGYMKRLCRCNMIFFAP